ncbi:hypothetical protein FHL15_009401 [Xylaria flabelliformis]|uniref:Uncharacterized protein n=1 Tax=Xylaria flabelliformis TaxID=2512241 RepID=A0A553HNW2_9PEZI|nr:hypothetical protein FHL15_009401 [Xylaria flabelliformis]
MLLMANDHQPRVPPAILTGFRIVPAVTKLSVRVLQAVVRIGYSNLPLASTSLHNYKLITLKRQKSSPKGLVEAHQIEAEEIEPCAAGHICDEASSPYQPCPNAAQPFA